MFPGSTGDQCVGLTTLPPSCADCLNTLGTGDADLSSYRVLQSFGSFVTISRRVMQICVFTRGWIPGTLHLITQYMEPFFE
jgi:hypothetical protein